MHKYVFFDREILKAEKAVISAAASAALYGRGVFTTVAIYDSKPLFWEKHWRRLFENAGKLNIDLSEFGEELMKNALSAIVEANKMRSGRARLTFFDETASRIWNLETARKTSFLITTADFQTISGDFRLTVSPFPVNSASPLANVKSCNYLEKIIALDEAKKRGFDEAVRINERGEIASACMANVFWIKDGKLFTPPIETGCLAGTTREFLIEELKCFETIANLRTLREADAIFLTSAGIGIRPVAKFEAKPFPFLPPQIIEIIEKYAEKTRAGAKID
jgi:branched-subunit amino acid aminotransferase/4-amino-4-deoxychorismate lyase